MFSYVLKNCVHFQHIFSIRVPASLIGTYGLIGILQVLKIIDVMEYNR